MDLKLSEEQLLSVISGAIIAQLTDEMRADIIKQAIIHLTTPVKDGYGRNTKETPLQRAFDRAVENVSHQVAHEFVANHPDFKAAIEAAMNGTAAAAMANIDAVREKLVSAAVSAIYEVGKERY